MITEEEISHQNNNFFDLSHPNQHIPTLQHTNTPTLQHSNTLKIHKFRKSVTNNNPQPTHNVDTRDPTGSKNYLLQRNKKVSKLSFDTLFI